MNGLDAMLALRTGWYSGFAAPVSVLNRVLVRRLEGVVVTSAFAEQELADLAQMAATQLHRVPLGVDLERFRPEGNARTHGRTLRLVHVGRLSREKSPLLAVGTQHQPHPGPDTAPAHTSARRRT